MARYSGNRYSVPVPSGSQFTLESEIDLNKAKGAFAKQGKVFLGGAEKTLINGFAVEYEAIGTISKIAGSNAVLYKHYENKENRIYFYAATGEIRIIDIINIPIHDHSSILQGGPAFATYYSDHEEEPPAEG